MKYSNLGSTGISVSRVCLGMMTYGSSNWRDWVLEYDQALPFVERALEAGINFFDSADVYSNGASEEVLGRAINDLGIDREDVVIATKCFSGTHDRRRNRWGLSRKHIIAACDASLARLGTDYIDLYQIHRFDYLTPIEETIQALSDLVAAGKVRYLGASSMHAWQMAKYLFTADAMGCARFVTMQNHYNLLYREEEREMIPLCIDQNVGVIPWSPLARGYLARTRDARQSTTRAGSDEFAKMLYKRESDLDIVDRNAEVAARLGIAPAQAALAWMLARPGVVAPIIGASKVTHLADAVAAVDLSLSATDIETLEELYEPHAIAGHA
ncbi:MAG: aldo/keto reductase [Gammaproteobacteria bacterium]|nr:aldo/keto reductase [Gammaproteobacteria bacterium]